MEAKDLQIGDWVMYNPNAFIEDEYEPTKEWFPTQINSGEDIDLAIENCYASIPLTPEILEKNGFENISKELYMYYSSAADGYIKVRLYDLLDGEWGLSIDNYDKFNDSHVRYTFDRCFLKVHKLQHALKLCGIDKEIEL